MNSINEITTKQTKLAIGLMSGTCTDGIDAALVEIHGYSVLTKVKLIKFITIPYSQSLRLRLLELASGKLYGSKEICKMNFYLGELLADACIKVCKEGQIETFDVDFIGSHGHTLFHQPDLISYFDKKITSTLQIGEAAIISERMNCPVISDFRVRDMAAGGQGAPLVPYTEFLLYSKEGKNIALQNIGGIGNITYLPASSNMKEILSFDTGPGNMIIDALVSIYTNHQKTYDENGIIAKCGNLNPLLLQWLLEDEYIHKKAPKTTGREYYGAEFVKRLIQKAETLNVPMVDIITTATMFTARAIEIGIRNFLPQIPDDLIVGGGGSQNVTLMKYIKSCLTDCNVLTNEDLGLNSNAKEAIAFAILANETLYGCTNNVPSATGANHCVTMGKITL